MTDRPNLLFLLTDEQRRETLGCYGNDYVQMPQLNRFAESACVFDDAHCVNPVCTPSRGCMLTGLYPHAHGAWHNNVPLHADARCLPELLPEPMRRDYRVEYHGKWHLGDELYAQHGYERMISIEDIYWQHFSDGRDKADRSDYHHQLLSEGFTLGNDVQFRRESAARLPEQYCKPRFLADRACEFIRQHRDRPWMLTVSMLEPHMPFLGPRDGQYDPADVPLFSNHDHVPDAAPEHAPPRVVLDRLNHLREHSYEDRDLSNEAGWRRITSQYLGLCSLIDTYMGRILDTLRSCGLDDNTIVVFTSDHGEMMGSHRLLQKQLLYREATRVPWLVRLPGQCDGRRLTGPVSQIDLVPTLLDLMGAPLPEHLHGRSLAEPLRSGGDVELTDRASPCVVVQDDPGMVTRSLVSPDGWRYSYYAPTDRHPDVECELYDLTADPGERRNLAADPAHADRIADMHGQLRAWQSHVGDRLSLD